MSWQRDQQTVEQRLGDVGIVEQLRIPFRENPPQMLA